MRVLRYVSANSVDNKDTIIIVMENSLQPSSTWSKHVIRLFLTIVLSCSNIIITNVKHIDEVDLILWNHEHLFLDSPK